MTPFVEQPRDPAAPMRWRAELMALPNQFFQRGDGRLPTSEEKAWIVEQAVNGSIPDRIFRNDLYSVLVGITLPFIRLTIIRHDRQACRDWQHIQQIKNELLGPEHEAVELFPAESRLVDVANEYHLFVHVDPHFRFPFGFGARCVREKSDAALSLLTGSC